MEKEPMLQTLITEIQNGKSLAQLAAYAGELEKLMTYYACALQEVETKFRVLDRQLSLGKQRNPIESIRSRIKSIASIQRKLTCLGKPYNCAAIEQNLNDVAGLRVICGYIEDIYILADCLLRQDDVRLIQKKDYIAQPKPNGYRSLHLIVEVPIFLSHEKRYVRVEVQLRTIAMETWAALEHRIRYKQELPPQTLERVADMLNECADISHRLDLKMQQVKNIVEQSKQEE